MQFEFSRPIDIEGIDHKAFHQVIHASDEECEALAGRYGIVSVTNLEAKITITPTGGHQTYHVTGAVEADITQESIVSQENVQYHVSEDIDTWFADRAKIKSTG